MGLTNFPNGVTSFGVPILDGSRFSSPWATHYFVDSDNGSDGNTGKEVDAAFATIGKAVSASTGGDVIYIRPKTYTLGTGFARYTEDVVVAQGGTAGSGNTATNANKSLIGVTQRCKPSDFLGVRWKYTTNTQLNVEAPGTHIENIGFFSEGATDAIFLETDGATRSKSGTDGSSIYNCAIKGEGKIRSNGGNEIQIINCRFQTKSDGTVGGINMVGTANDVARTLIQGCEFIGGNANNMSAAAIIGAANWYDVVIRDCYFNAESDTGEYINVSGSTNTGIVANCYFASADITTTSIVIAGDVFGVGCYDDDGLQAAPIA
jgi:hypothetical protein